MIQYVCMYACIPDAFSLNFHKYIPFAELIFALLSRNGAKFFHWVTYMCHMMSSSDHKRKVPHSREQKYPEFFAAMMWNISASNMCNYSLRCIRVLCHHGAHTYVSMSLCDCMVACGFACAYVYVHAVKDYVNRCDCVNQSAAFNREMMLVRNLLQVHTLVLGWATSRR
jgi:hypothetical protein